MGCVRSSTATETTTLTRSQTTKILNLTHLRSTPKIRLTHLKLVSLEDWRGPRFVPDWLLNDSSKLTLKRLTLTRTDLHRLDLSGFKALERVDVSDNSELSEFEFRGNVNLWEFKARNMKSWAKIPPALAGVKSLKSLDLSGCRGIASVEGFEFMEGLEVLLLDCCGLTGLPAALGGLKKLVVISVRNNQVTPRGLPSVLFEGAKELHTLNLMGNPGMTEANLLACPGVESYISRRKARIDRQLAGGSYEPQLSLL